MRKIAVIPGDGFGPEITAEAIKVLEAVMSRSGLDLQFAYFDVSMGKYIKTGTALSDTEAHNLSNTCDAILLGSFAESNNRKSPNAHTLIFDLLSKLNLVINYHPVKLLHEKYCPLKDKKAKDINFALFRHNHEGVNSALGNIIRKGSLDEEVLHQCIVTRKGIGEIIQYTFDFARKKGYDKVTICGGRRFIQDEKDLWSGVMEELSQDYSDIKKEIMALEDAVRHLLRTPERYQVVVTCNTFGDTLTDLATELQGGSGLVAEGHLHPGKISLFMPVLQSSQNDIEKNTVSPLAAIAAVELLLDNLGFDQEAKWVNSALKYSLDTDNTTRQLGGRLQTKQVGDFIASHVLKGRIKKIHG